MSDALKERDEQMPPSLSQLAQRAEQFSAVHDGSVASGLVQDLLATLREMQEQRDSAQKWLKRQVEATENATVRAEAAEREVAELKADVKVLRLGMDAAAAQRDVAIGLHQELQRDFAALRDERDRLKAAHKCEFPDKCEADGRICPQDGSVCWGGCCVAACRVRAEAKHERDELFTTLARVEQEMRTYTSFQSFSSQQITQWADTLASLRKESS